MNQHLEPEKIYNHHHQDCSIFPSLDVFLAANIDDSLYLSNYTMMLYGLNIF